MRKLVQGQGHVHFCNEVFGHNFITCIDRGMRPVYLNAVVLYFSYKGLVVNDCFDRYGSKMFSY